MTTTHKHHIIPRHFGGSDHAWNIAELTIEEHADAHRRLYEAFGSPHDRWAWKYLTWQATQEPEYLREAQRVGGKLSQAKRTPEGRLAIYQLGIGKMTKEERSALGKRMNEWRMENTTHEQRSAWSKRVGKMGYRAMREKCTDEEWSARQGKRNKGMSWYNNGEKETKCFPGTEPDGFMRGRLNYRRNERTER